MKHFNASLAVLGLFLGIGMMLVGYIFFGDILDSVVHDKLVKVSRHFFILLFNCNMLGRNKIVISNFGLIWENFYWISQISPGGGALT